MPVSSTRPDYNDYCKKWSLIRDVVNSNVKTEKYICDVDTQDKHRSIQYRKDAQFTNFTLRTKAGLVGAVFRKKMLISLPDSIKYLEKDCTGSKMPLSKLAQECVGEVLMTGRYGLLVDYPASEDGLTAKEVADSNLKALIYRYTAENIINWEVKIENGVPKTSLVVLKECISQVGEDGFEWEKKEQYRVLKRENGIYIQYVYSEDEELQSVFIPKKANGKAWDYIPFTCIGAEDNDLDIDSAPLYDLSELNLGHLRNSADYEESVHIVGSPTVIFTSDMTSEQFKAANPNGIKIGSRVGYNLGVNGDAKFLQPDPNVMADEAMKRKEEQAVMIGARLIVPQADRETAEAARMRHSGETSILSTIADNVEAALEDCCRNVLVFMSENDESEAVKLKINDQFFDHTVDPNMIMAQIQLFNSSIIAKADLRQKLRTLGVIDEDRADEDIDSDLKSDPPPAPEPIKESNFNKKPVE